MNACIRVSADGKLVEFTTSGNIQFQSSKIDIRLDNSDYYILFQEKVIKTALAQPNGFTNNLISQLDYQDNGVVIRFVTSNNEKVQTGFTMSFHLDTITNVLDPPKRLIEVYKSRVN